VKKLLAFSLFVVLFSATCANAEMWYMTAYTGTTASLTPLARISVTRTSDAYEDWDLLEFRLEEWLVTAYQTGGLHDLGQEIRCIVGTFTAYNPAGGTAGISLPGSIAGFKYRTTWSSEKATPTYPAPASFVNMENIADGFSRTGTSPNFTSLTGAWYTDIEGYANLAVEDYTPPGSGPDSDDGKDQTLLFAFYVTSGSMISFAADASTGTEALGIGDDNTISYISCFIPPFPEPGTIAMLTSGLACVFCYAWRKRKKA
jgi:hypothetical protein